MSTGETQREAQAAPAAEAAGLLDQVLAATPQTERNRAAELVEAFVGETLKGTLVYKKDLMRSIQACVQAIDAKISKQLAAVMHTPEFQKMEGTWRGMHYLVMNSETGTQLKIKVLNVSKRELFKDLDRAVEFDQSQLFKKLYENEFGTPGGEPYGALIGDYEFTNHPEDIDMLTQDVQRRGGGVLPVHLRRLALAVRVGELRGARQAARPGEDFRRRGVHQVEVVPRLRGLALRHPGDAARALPAPLRQEHQAGGRVRFRGGRAGQQGERQAGAARPLRLDERRLHVGRPADRRLRQDRLVYGDPRAGERRQGRGPAGPHLQDHGRRQRPEVPHGNRHHRPPRGGAERAGLLCPCATTRTPTTRCSSGRRPRRSRRSTTGPRPPPTRPSPPGCRTSWPPRGSPTS